MKSPSKRARAKNRVKQRTTSASSSSSSAMITDLPSHILVEILCRLPIKTLVGTKSVCKSWLHLISDPHFAKMHEARSKVEICFLRYCPKFICIPKLHMGNFYFTKTSHSLQLNTVLEIPTTFRGDLKHFVNSCNGLLCYCGDSRKFALIWNPITSEFLTVPAPKERAGLLISYGLGFSQKTNRFKLLCIYTKIEDLYSLSNKKEIIGAEICTIKKEGCSWKTIESRTYSLWVLFGETFFRGALHWFGGKDSDVSIVSFDFEDEKFATIPLPPHFRTVDITVAANKIGALEGCLFVSERTERCFNIWLMKDYGDQESWTRVICTEFTRRQRGKYLWCTPLHSLDSGELLMI